MIVTLPPKETTAENHTHVFCDKLLGNRVGVSFPIIYKGKHNTTQKSRRTRIRVGVGAVAAVRVNITRRKNSRYAKSPGAQRCLYCLGHIKSSTPLTNPFSFFFRRRYTTAPYAIIHIKTTIAIAVTMTQVGVSPSSSTPSSAVLKSSSKLVELGASVGLLAVNKDSQSTSVSGNPQLHRGASKS